jgi:zinc protease
LLTVPFTRRTLPNGLDVIVHESRRVPIVAVNVWYHVGSRHEAPDRTGLAHLFEHLMFEGSAHQPSSYFGPLQDAGGALNGSTNCDRTNYWETVPAGAAARALWMESDRMGFLLPVLTQERFDTQRAVVLNERRQNYENRPYGLVPLALSEALYPEAHPYRWPTIGYVDDLQAASLSDAHEFFARFYHPGNASLAIAGDIETDRALDLAAEYFGSIPRGRDVEKSPAAPVTARPRRLVLEDRVELARLYLAWPSPAMFGSGDAALDLVADVLANGRTSRLYASLVHDRRIATELGANQASREIGGHFVIAATAAPGHTLIELHDAVCAAIGSLVAGGVTDAELERGRIQAEAAFMLRVQTVGGFGGRADQLNAYNVLRGTPDGFAADLARYTSATAGDLQKAAATWLDPANAVALSVVPLGETARALPGSEPCRPT